MSRKRKQNITDHLTDKAATKAAAVIGAVQKRFAMFMNKRTKKFSVLKWKVLLVVFGLVWGGLSLYLISTAFTKHPIIQRNNGRLFITKPINSDSLRMVEKIYELEKNKRK